MKIAAHTMGTPHLSPFEAVDFFAEVGYDGVEFVSREGHRCSVTRDWSAADRRRLKDQCQRLGLSIVCLASYGTDINAELEPLASQELALLSENIVLAHDLGAPCVRLYGGRQVAHEEWAGSIDRVASRLRSLTGLCRQTGVKIAIENHFGTLTRTAAETMALINAVGTPEVGVLYDQANIAYDRGEEYSEAIRLQAPHILHVHAKDLVYLTGASESDVSSVTHLSSEKRIAKWVLLGHGVLQWPGILRALAGIGYDRYITVEYTYKPVYRDELPAPEIGMPECLHYLRGLVSAMEAPATAL